MVKLVKRELKLKRDWIGARVRARRELPAYIIVAAGTEGTVESTYRGRFGVQFDGCEHCGARVYRRGTAGQDLEYLGHPA